MVAACRASARTSSYRSDAPPPAGACLLLCVAVQFVLFSAAWSGVSAETVQNSTLAFTIAANGSWELLDRGTGEVWRSNPDAARFATVTGKRGTSIRTRTVASFAGKCVNPGSLILDWRDGTYDFGTVRFTVRLLREGRGLQVSWEQIGGQYVLTDVRFPDSSFRATKDEGGYLVVPNRMGIIVPAGENAAETRTYPTYGSYFGLTMSMAGSVKNGSGVLVWWDDPYTSLQTTRSADLSSVDMSLLHKGRFGSITIRPAGKGGYAAVARTYREVARDRGLLVTLREKWPDGDAPVTGREYLSSQCVYNNDSGVGKTVEATFAQVAGTAEHMKKDIGIDSAMYNLWGWGNMGYDRHPDMLPAAPECGGNAALQDCSARVKALGYLFGLRDNYQDIFMDVPSWDPSLVMRNADGSLRKGGVWAGAQSYLLNSQKGFELAQRPQNIPGIRQLFDPDFYYIDTTFASPLYEDFSSEHPLTLKDDMYWKKRLCQYARENFGVFGSEEGVEWGVPFSDYFESLMTARTSPTSSEVQIPLFEMVYGDCVQMYQGDRTTVSTPKSVLDHILCAEMPVQWVTVYNPAQPWCRVLSVSRTGYYSIRVAYEWKTYSQPAPANYGNFVHYADPASTDCWAALLTDSHPFVLPTTQWPANSTYIHGPFTITNAALAKPASGSRYYDIYVGMTSNPDGTGSRVNVRGFDICLANGYVGGYQRFCIGRLKLDSDGSVSVSDPVLPDLYSFARCDTQRDSSYQNDGLTLNTYRICSPLNRLTADTPMTAHRFVTGDRMVQQSEFGDVRITVNYGAVPYAAPNAVLPEYGFLVESPRMVAFRATSYGERTFAEATMMVAVSKDGKPLAESGSIDTYRAYGDTAVTIAGKDIKLE